MTIIVALAFEDLYLPYRLKFRLELMGQLLRGSSFINSDSINV